MPPFLLRLAYISEFFVVLIAVLFSWSEIGGQNHLDLTPWYDILVLSVSLALVVVFGTAAAVRHENAWNFRSVVCLLAGLVIAGGMAAVTYYYHMHEDDDDGDAESGSHALLYRHSYDRPPVGFAPDGFAPGSIAPESFASGSIQPSGSTQL